MCRCLPGKEVIENMVKTTIFTSSVALALSCVSLGGCDDTRTNNPSVRARAVPEASVRPEARPIRLKRADAVASKSIPSEPAKLASFEQPLKTPIADTEAPPIESEESLKPALEGPSYSVKRLSVTLGVADREPLPVSDFKLGDGPIYAFVELSNESDEEQSVVVTFESEGVPAVGHVTLTVPPNQPRWRTWAHTRMVQDPGLWTAVVSSQDGSRLAAETFEVGGEKAPPVPEVLFQPEQPKS